MKANGHVLARASAIARRIWRWLCRWTRCHEPLIWSGTAISLGLAAAYYVWRWRSPLGGDKTWEWPEFLVLSLTLLGVVVARQVHFWNQRRATIEIASRWNDGDVSHARLKVLDAFPAPWDPKEPLESDTLEKRFKANPGLRNHLVIVINHLDMVAMGVDEGIYAPTPIHHLYGYVLTEWHRHFRVFIDHERGRSPAKYEPTVTPLWYLDLVGQSWATNLARWRAKQAEADK